MFHDKKHVDRHVQEITRKLKTENEINLRSYNIAKLYYQVGDYESAKKYVSRYLSVREDAAGAHKLLGQTLEALDQKEAALAEYKCSLEIEGRQDDLVLKVCELLADTDVGVDVSRARYWLERADRQFPHHPVIFQLKEKLLTVDRPSENAEDLVALIASELSARPMDVTLRVKLLRHYMDNNKLEEAYKHVLGVEASHAFRDNILWYQAVCELLGRCKESKRSDWNYWMLYVSTLERLATLSLKEQGDGPKKSIPEAAQAVLNFDQSLSEAELHKKYSSDPALADQMFVHMWGQLHFHLACLLLRKTKREHSSWTEAGRLCSPLLLCALHTNPPDPTALWATRLKEQRRAEVNLWYREASYRCSQAGHVLQDYARDDTKRFLDKIDKFCSGAWRERVYQRIFVSRVHQQMVKTSYFANHLASSPPLRLGTHNELKHHDEVSEEVWPSSLHHQIWLGIKSRPHHSNSSGPHPHQYSHIFPELQFSVYNLNSAAADSLSQLDVDAFLNAAVLCASVVVEEQQRSGFWSPDRLPTLPADITNTLCSSAQEKWWTAAYKMYREQEGVGSEIGEIRQILQRGLEVVRCIDNHGLHPCILVHLARIFNHRVKIFKEKNEEHSDIPALEARCELYWSAAVPLLERLQNNQIIRSTGTKLFDYQGKDMNNVELTNALEEGRLLLAQRYLRDKQYEQAIEALQALKCPEASFQQGQIYKKLADELVSSLPRESLTSEMRSQHIIMLSKARDCFYLTLDRLRSPGTNPKHPLNSELCTHISGIENELKRIDPDLWRNDINRNECDELSDESYSSAHSGEQPVINTSYGHSSNVHKLNTPHRSTHRTPNQSSTPCRPQHQDILDLSRNRTEARPSPERLDAQIRQLLHSRDNVMQTIMDQNKTLLESNKTMVAKLEELQKEVADLRLETQKQRLVPQVVPQVIPQVVSQVPVTVNPTLEEDPYVLGHEDYGELSYGVPATAGHPLFFCPTPTFPRNMYPTAQGYQPLSFQPPRIEPVTNYIPPQPSKAPPVNVVITTSDTLPTTVPPVQPPMSVTIPPHHRLGGGPQPPNVPHNYQITMPLQATIPTTVNLPPLYTTLTTTIPTTNTAVTEMASGNASILSTSAANDSNEWYVETEHDPIPDFVPVVPLPAEVELTTGEEGETCLYSARAKLFRFVDKEWKERGVGYVKLLRNEEGKVRLLMRRDQVLKICANHLLRPDMELTKMPNNDKALMWVANDFADEEVKLEKLCIKFKTEDEAANFKMSFDKAKASLPTSVETVSKTEEKAKIVEAAKPAVVPVPKEATNIPVVVGGFSFSSNPIIQEKKSNESAKAAQKSNETPKPSPFAGFSFTRPDSTSESDQAKNNNTRVSAPTINAVGVQPAQQKTDVNKQKSLAEMFKPAIGSWECKSCYTRNDATNVKCLACESPAPNAKPDVAPPPKNGAANAQTKSLAEMFKPAAGSWECGACYTRNDGANTKCLACESPSPNAAQSITQSTVAAPNNGSPPIPNQAKFSTDKTPLSQLFKPATGSWECKACYIVNSGSNSYCVACDSPKDPSMPAKPKAGGFNIASSSASSPSFSFGIPASAPKDPASSFTFGVPKSDSKAAGDSAKPSSLTFGSSSLNSGMTFSFGTPQNLGLAPNPDKPFTFGSPGKSFDFQFQAKSPLKSPGGGETSEDEVAESDDVYFAPVIPLPDKVDVKTGEENEEVLYSHRAKLFRYESGGKEWKERGLGDIKLLKHRESGKLRLLMRRDQVLKLCLNHIITTDMEFTPKDDKTWLWYAADYSEGDISHENFACRFKTAEIAQEFKSAIDNAKESVKTPAEKAAAPKTTEKSPVTIKKNLFGRSNSSSEVEIVYETTVTPEEKAAALKLKLPENFYAYKQMPDCPGCIGCKDNQESPLISKTAEVTKTVTPPSSIETPKPVSTGLFDLQPSISAPPKLTSPPAPADTKVINFGSTASALQASTAPTNTSTLSFGEKPVVGIFGNVSSTTSIPSTTASTLGSSFSTKSTISFGAPANPSSWGNIFGGSSSTPATTNSGHIFGGSSATPATTNSSNLFGGSSSTPATTNSSNIFGGSSSTPATTNSSNIFGGSSSTPATTNSSNIFGGSSSTPATTNSSNIFGGSVSTTATTGAGISFGANTPKTGGFLFGAQPAQPLPAIQPIFGSVSTAPSTKTIFSFGAATNGKPAESGTEAKSFTDLKICSPASLTSATTPSAPNIFAGSGTKLFGNTPVPEISKADQEFAEKSRAFKGLPTPAFGVPASIQPNPVVLESVNKVSSETKKEGGFSFLPTENVASFSTLAAKAPQKPAFQTDPNFSFAGAGATVFGAKQVTNASQSQAKTDSAAKIDENEEDGEPDNGEEHDPHFEPIVPLPDAIEVRTGEEDEEKVFGQRAKLYRYVNATKEWKERGVGEMKLLHHVAHGTYRLLLRREQVHKVVCNLLLTTDTEFRTLNSSDRAWCWAGMNYAEEEPALEELAIKFKNPDLAVQFKEAIDMAQQALQERQNNSQVNKYEESTEVPEEGEHDEDDDDDNENDIEEEDEDELDEEEEDEHSVMFEKRATLMVQENGDTTWKTVAMGDLKVLYDHNIFGARIVLEADSTREILSNTVISMQSQMQVIEKECFWSAKDYALEPPVKRNLKAVFSSVHVARDMYMVFEEGQGYAREFEIIEEYDAPEEE